MIYSIHACHNTGSLTQCLTVVDAKLVANSAAHLGGGTSRYYN